MGGGGYLLSDFHKTFILVPSTHFAHNVIMYGHCSIVYRETIKLLDYYTRISCLTINCSSLIGSSVKIMLCDSGQLAWSKGYSGPKKFSVLPRGIQKG